MCQHVTRYYLLQLLNHYYINCENWCRFCNNCAFCAKLEKLEEQMYLKKFNSINKNCNQWLILYHKINYYSITLIALN